MAMVARPAAMGASSLGSSVAGIEPSASHMTRTAPRAASMPTRTAWPLPRLGEVAITRRPAMRSASARHRATVPSFEPSSTTTSS